MSQFTLRMTAALAMVFIVTGCVASHYYQPGKGYIETQSVMDHCRIAGKSSGSGGYSAQSTLIGAVLVGSVGGLAQGISSGSKVGDCMAQNGYVNVPLSTEEQREFDAMKSDEDKAAYLGAAYRKKLKSGEIVGAEQP
tara:strand:- start:169 stop:582 length:414 start_codon:yes stop_codon:yes gene_type:complete